MGYDESETTARRCILALIIGFVLVVGIIATANAYGSYLYRVDEAQRHAIVQERGGEPVCAGPDGSVYVKYPGLQKQSGSQG